MGTSADLGNNWLRDYRTDGNPSSLVNPPTKADGRATIVDIDGRIGALEANVTGVSIVEPTWVALAAITGTYVGQRGEVFADAGTHTDPVVGGTKANTGIYTWSASPAGWQWISADSVSSKAPINSPTFTGTPVTTAPTAGDDSTRIPTTHFVAALVGTETTARTAADTTLTTNIAAEATTRASADTTLTTNLASEATTRATADTTLQTNITAEATTRAAADTTLTGSVSTLTTGLASEATTRAAADTAETAARTTQDNVLFAHTGASYFETTAAVLDSIPVVDLNRAVLTTLAPGSITSLARSAISSPFFETTVPLSGSILIDPNHRILAQDAVGTSPEIITARGDRTSLGARIGQGLTPYGDPIGPVYGSWLLQQTRMRLMKLSPSLLETAQFIICLIGDSYTQNAGRYSGAVAKTLQDAYGNAGVGWISWAWALPPLTGTWTSISQPALMDGNVRTDLVTICQVIGTWTDLYNTGSINGPSISQVTSSTAGDYLRWNFPAGHTAANLFYSGDGTGVVQVSWNDGSTYGSNINLSTVGADHVAMSGVPGGAATARIKVISGNVTICGVDMQSSANGVRVHKLGGSGSTSAQWAAVTPATWAAQIAGLGPNLTGIMQGTNDQGTGLSTAQSATNIAQIAANVILGQSNATDILIMSPAENQRLTNPIPMPQFAQAQREMAIANGYAYLDFQYYFGSPDNFAAAYANSNAARPWYASDGIHPDPTTGGRVMASAIVRLLTSAI